MERLENMVAEFNSQELLIDRLINWAEPLCQFVGENSGYIIGSFLVILIAVALWFFFHDVLRPSVDIFYATYRKVFSIFTQSTRLEQERKNSQLRGRSRRRCEWKK